MGAALLAESIFPVSTPVVHLVTAHVAHRRPVLAHADTHAIIVETCRTMRRWRVYGGVTMPEYCQFIVCPWEDPGLPATDFLEGFKRIMRRNLLEHFSESDRSRTPVDVLWEWQKGGETRQLTNEECRVEHCRQLGQNPVRAGLIPHGEEWPFVIGYSEEGLSEPVR